MNHGYCINCWWYLATINKSTILTQNGLVVNFGNGKCFMHNGGNDCNGHDYKIVDGKNYCPDYYNRKKGDKEMKKTLTEWIKE